MLKVLEVIKIRSLHISNEIRYSITGKDKVKIWKTDCQICQIDKRSPREELSAMRLCNSCPAKTCREAWKVEKWKSESREAWKGDKSGEETRAELQEQGIRKIETAAATTKQNN